VCQWNIGRKMWDVAWMIEDGGREMAIVTSSGKSTGESATVNVDCFVPSFERWKSVKA
jgi:hypothetical protein